MRILLVTPSLPRSGTGNGTTTERWARILRDLGHRVSVGTEYDGRRTDLLIALHARRSARSIRRFHRMAPGHPIFVAMTGTDLYHDLNRTSETRRAIELATRIIVLQSRAVDALPATARPKARVILQSVARPQQRSAPLRDRFEVLVVSNLRAVKDPLRTAMAVRRLPEESRILVRHVGTALDGRLLARAEREARDNPRYDWLGPAPRSRVLRWMTRARVLCLTSRLEGGANVISEALAAHTPILSSRIDGSLGLLGDLYPGYFPVGDTAALRALLLRAERERDFLADLARRCRELAPLISPAREKKTWRQLLHEIT